MKVAAPPAAPLAPAERDFRAGLRRSVALHLALAVTIILNTLVFPPKIVPFIPTLRVDLVGLPDQLKKDKTLVAPPPAEGQKPDDLTQKLKEAEDQAKKLQDSKTAAETADPDEMVLKRAGKEKKEREKKLRSALDRIKALAKIQDDASPSPKSQLLKGNQVSKGSSVSADARENGTSSYLDLLRQHLQNHWELPVWLARQNLSAQVQISIDAQGRLRGYRFVKPSGNNQFDAEVKKTLLASQPFPIPGNSEGVASSGVLVGFPL